MKIIFENLGKLVLKIEIDLGREPKILSKIYILRSKFFHHAIPQYIRIFRDFYDSEVRFPKKLFYHRFFLKK